MYIKFLYPNTYHRRGHFLSHGDHFVLRLLVTSILHRDQRHLDDLSRRLWIAGHVVVLSTAIGTRMYLDTVESLEASFIPNHSAALLSCTQTSTNAFSNIRALAVSLEILWLSFLSRSFTNSQLRLVHSMPKLQRLAKPGHPSLSPHQILHRTIVAVEDIGPLYYVAPSDDDESPMNRCLCSQSDV